jgi:hypothetical protein
LPVHIIVIRCARLLNRKNPNLSGFMVMNLMMFSSVLHWNSHLDDKSADDLHGCSDAKPDSRQYLDAVFIQLSIHYAGE